MAVLSLREDPDNRVVLESLVEEAGQSSINHLDVQGDHILVGTDRDLRLWGVKERDKPKLLSTVPAKHVCCCVLFYPYAACTGLVLRQGLQVWNMETKVLLRHLHTDLSMWVVQVQGDLLATSMSSGAANARDHSIFLHDTKELVDVERYSDKELWSRQIVVTSDDDSDPHIALNSTCLFSVTREDLDSAKISCWDFWSYRQQQTWDCTTFLQNYDLDTPLT